MQLLADEGDTHTPVYSGPVVGLDRCIAPVHSNELVYRERQGERRVRGRQQRQSEETGACQCRVRLYEKFVEVPSMTNELVHHVCCGEISSSPIVCHHHVDTHMSTWQLSWPI